MVGFDDSELAREARLALTTVRQPHRGPGLRYAALLEQLDGDRTKPPAAVVLKTELVPAPLELTVSSGRGRSG